MEIKTFSKSEYPQIKNRRVVKNRWNTKMKMDDHKLMKKFTCLPDVVPWLVVTKPMVDGVVVSERM